MEMKPENIKPRETRPVEIRRNDRSALRRFADLNIEWIKELHYVEPSDQKMSDHPEIYLENGGSVFSAHIDGCVAGACALKQDENGLWELTKMAVDKAYRGHGIGEALLGAAEHYAKTELGQKKIFLLSNTGNAAAIRLYKRRGWQVFMEGKHPKYDRCNIGMEKIL